MAAVPSTLTREEVIRLEGVYKNYYLGNNTVVPVLKNLNLAIRKNEYVAMMGPSGSGKSTLMNILGCLDTVTSGKYYLAGEDVSKQTDNALAAVRNKYIGFVFQTFNLMPRMTALENVALPLVYAGMGTDQRNERARMMLDAVGLKERGHHRPNELSGGQKQRVAIARAMVNDPSVILADEPTGNLDSKTSEEIMALFEQIHANGNTVILVTHEDDISRHAHRIIRLRDGEVNSDERNPNPVRTSTMVPGGAWL